MTPDEVLAGVLAGDAHAGGIRCLRLHQLDPGFLVRLTADVDRLVSRGRPSDVTDPRHVTNWVLPFGTVVQYSLLNTSGRFDDFSNDHHAFARGKGFAHAADHPALATFLDLFPDAVNCRVNVMGPSSGLSPHEEHVLTYAPDGSVVAKLRFHLPLHTTSEATLVLDEQVFTLESGVVHFVNHGCVHAAANRGSEPRTHLVWDMILTRRTFDLMFGDDDPPPRCDGFQRPVGHRRRSASSVTGPSAGCRRPWRPRTGTGWPWPGPGGGRQEVSPAHAGSPLTRSGTAASSAARDGARRPASAVARTPGTARHRRDPG